MATNAAGQTLYSYQMSASSRPTTCTISLHNHDAEVIFSSGSLNVAPACTTWIQSSANGGELWDNGPPQTSDTLTQVCALSDRGGHAYAAILDSRGQIYGQEACTRLISGGWTESATPTLIAGGWAGVEPSFIDFSGDAGNIVTGISWSSWTANQAVGEGASVIQNCVPNCAQGTDKKVPTTVTLSSAANGTFSEITEERNGQSSTGYNDSQGWPLSAQ